MPALSTAATPEPVATFSFSGHQTFPLRISWLPKAATLIANGENPFADSRAGTQQLGIGKNMVEALHCWVEFFCIAQFAEKKGPRLTTFGAALFGDKGYDRYLEDDQTLWLLHWHATTRAPKRFFAWHWITNELNQPDFTFDEALRAFKVESDRYARPLSEVTLRQHLDVFLGTYVASTTPLSGMVAEDLLESPLAALNFIRETEPHVSSMGKQAAYSVDHGPKHTISDQVFRFALHDWWARHARSEQTASFRLITNAENSPGRVFRIPEREMNERLQRLARRWPEEFRLTESNNQRQVERRKLIMDPYPQLRDVYQRTH